jgi:peptidoglycan hydrolase CwlO-like protein
MKSTYNLVLALLFVLLAPAHAVTEGLADNPVQKVLSLLTELEAKVIKDGEAEQKAYEEFVDWCQTGAKDKEWEIKTAKAEIEELEATISNSGASIESHTAKIEELAAAITTDENDLEAATSIRKKEHADFTGSEGELVDALDTLDRAIAIIEKNMRGSALLQTKVNTKNMQNLIQVLKTVIEAASLNNHDQQTLVALAQSNAGDSDGELDDAAELGAPDPAAYKAHGGSILDVLEDMKEKAETQLQELRKAEMNAKHNYEMLKQSLEDQMAADNKELADSKASKAAATETKAVAEGDLAVTQKDLKDAENVLGGMHENCMQTAQDHEATVKGRAEELAALAEAKKILSNIGGATEKTYSFMQWSKGSGAIATGSNLKSKSDLANFEVVTVIKRLAKQQHSQALALLAQRIAGAYRSSQAEGEDPFVKVRTMISDMIDRLVKEGAEEAQHKAWCDEEMAKTKKRRAELNYDIEKLTTRIDKSKAMSTKLKEEIAELNKEIAEITKSQSESDKIRADEKAAFTETKADLEQGLEGVRMGLKVLKDYYASAGLLQVSAKQPAAPEGHEKSSGAGTAIIGFLEVIESDFAKNLAEVTTEEDAAAVQYQRTLLENKVSKTMKESDVKYKTKESAALDKSVAEDSADLESAQNELDSVLEAELKGLKEALAILEGEAVLLQRNFRGIKKH